MSTNPVALSLIYLSAIWMSNILRLSGASCLLKNEIMKTIEKVLLAIKMECDRQKKLAEISCFDKIADRAQVSRHSLSIYLEELQERGYIKYSLTDKFIYLTRQGNEFIV